MRYLICVFLYVSADHSLCSLTTKHIMSELSQGRHASQSYDILLICFDPVPLTSTDNNARASDAPAPTQPSGPQREFGPSRPQPESEVSRAQPASEVSREVSRAQPESEVS
eukprot:Rmarinus@m.2266